MQKLNTIIRISAILFFLSLTTLSSLFAQSGLWTWVHGDSAYYTSPRYGIKGIADHARIMVIRAVPNGDERDKDVANAIRYAVNNGAKIINMSFGKSYSPEKKEVDEAVRYAESKGVLLVHAAGNDGKNNDVSKNFPSPILLTKKVANNWIEVGASGYQEQALAASFSNFGKKSVHLFSPGVSIYSTTPNNTYKNFDGTSMASPSVAGVAALLMSYYPTLTVTQVKDILMRSTRQFGDLKVYKSGLPDPVKFSSLSISGGIISAFNAIKMAQEELRTNVNK